MTNIAFTPQVSGLSSSAPADGRVAAKAPVTAPEDPSPSKDSVKLSVAAQVKLMHHQGLSRSTIAAQIGIPVSQVNGYIPGSSVTAPSVPAGPEPAPSEVAAAPGASKGSATPAGEGSAGVSAPRANG